MAREANLVSISPLHISIHTVATSHHRSSALLKTESKRHRAGNKPVLLLRDEGLLQARCRHVEACIAMVFAIPHHAIRCTTRGKAGVARARQVAMYLSHTSLALSLTQVGHLFERDRTTVGHACRLVEDLRDDRDFDQLIACLEKAVRAGSTESLERLVRSDLMVMPKMGGRHDG